MNSVMILRDVFRHLARPVMQDSGHFQGTCVLACFVPFDPTLEILEDSKRLNSTFQSSLNSFACLIFLLVY